MAAYYHWDDKQSSDQAVWVANENIFDKDAIHQWSENEGMLEKYGDFFQRVESI